jgi:8-oxo-dGTP pyrophosphatase MutT (NUDIX family)
MEIRNISIDFISEQLSEAYEPPYEEAYPSALLSDAPKPAAVLIPFTNIPTSDDNKTEWHLLFTRRSDSLVEHRGQVAFPGGRSDPEDTSPEMTALREANEEIGIRKEDVNILGRMNSFPTISNYCITPIVGVIPWPYDFKLASDEVSRVFTIPLSWLINPNNHEIKHRIIPIPYAGLQPGESIPVIYFHPYDNEILWGVSAYITLNLIDILVND